MKRLLCALMLLATVTLYAADVEMAHQYGTRSKRSHKEMEASEATTDSIFPKQKRFKSTPATPPMAAASAGSSTEIPPLAIPLASASSSTAQQADFSLMPSMPGEVQVSREFLLYALAAQNQQLHQRLTALEALQTQRTSMSEAELKESAAESDSDSESPSTPSKLGNVAKRITGVKREIGRLRSALDTHTEIMTAKLREQSVECVQRYAQSVSETHIHDQQLADISYTSFAGSLAQLQQEFNPVKHSVHGLQASTKSLKKHQKTYSDRLTRLEGSLEGLVALNETTAKKEADRKRIQELEEQVARLAQTVADYTASLQGHTAVLGHHAATIEDHTQTLATHEQILKEDTSILVAYGKGLEAHTSSLVDHARVLTVHAGALDDLSVSVNACVTSVEATAQETATLAREFEDTQTVKNPDAMLSLDQDTQDFTDL
jgi:chromosome segregation ATPase